MIASLLIALPVRTLYEQYNWLNQKMTNGHVIPNASYHLLRDVWLDIKKIYDYSNIIRQLMDSWSDGGGL